VVHHVQEAAAARLVQAVVARHVQVAAALPGRAAVARHVQVEVDLRDQAVQPAALPAREARVQVVVHHVQVAVDLQGTAAARAEAVIEAAQEVDRVAVLRSAVLSHPRSMIFSKRKKPSSWKV
jgi:hypothetical protein